MKKLFDRQQRTLARPVEVRGVGFLTGRLVTLRFRPAPASTGVVFVRTDLGPDACIPARVEQVSGTQRRTTLGRPPLCVGLVEHVLAALAGLRIDNCYLELDAPEPPGLDGSAQEFADAICQAGFRTLSATRPAWTVTEPVVLSQNGAILSLHPADDGTQTLAGEGSQSAGTSWCSCAPVSKAAGELLPRLRPQLAAAPADAHAERDAGQLSQRSGLLPNLHPGGRSGRVSQARTGIAQQDQRFDRVRSARAHRQYPAFRRRTGPAQDSRHRRRSVASGPGPVRTRGRLSFGTSAERRIGPSVEQGTGTETAVSETSGMMTDDDKLRRSARGVLRGFVCMSGGGVN